VGSIPMIRRHPPKTPTLDGGGTPFTQVATGPPGAVLCTCSLTLSGGGAKLLPKQGVFMLAFTTNEVAALTGLEEKVIRKDVEQGILEVTSPPRFAVPALIYFLARAVFTFTLAPRDRRRLYRLISDALATGESRLDLGPGWSLDVGNLEAKLRERVAAFEAWKNGVVVDEAILGGEPVFPRSRLAVRHVGEMLRRGTERSEILEDYPYLSNEDLDFALFFTTAYPRIGRPHAQAAPR
jgi:uncharacterized protein (DUF433 family)